jgi:hypothetical protein
MVHEASGKAIAPGRAGCSRCTACACARSLCALRNVFTSAAAILLRTDLRSAQAGSRCTDATNWHDGQISKKLSSPFCKNIPLNLQAKSATYTVRLTRLRGARDRHERAVRCDGRGRRTGRRRPTRTAKSCGSGAAVLALSCGGFFSCAATVAKEPFTGESTK